MGIGLGYATLGRIGFEGRFDYGAIGTVTNLAARLCGEAADGQILIHPAGRPGRRDVGPPRAAGTLELKGLPPLQALNVVDLL